MNLLALETSTPYLSMAIAKGGAIFERHMLAEQRHAEMALGELEGLLNEAGLSIKEIDGIAYGEGPGAFTGVRIACGMTQGLALARGLPVVGVGSLLAVAEESGAQNALVCLDARMSEVYHAAYRKENDEWREVTPPGLCAPRAVPIPGGGNWLGCGSGFEAYAEQLEARFATQLDATLADIQPTACAILRLARPRFERGEGKDAALALPIYLRDKVAFTTEERNQGKKQTS